MSSSFGTILSVTTFGESHGKGVGAILDGCPAKIHLCEEDVQKQLDRRRPGQSKLTTKREETDRVTILSGVENGKTLGVPIALFVANKDQRPHDYETMRSIPRPSHADYTYQIKYGIRSSSGGGRSSARETVGRVAAGAIADKFLYETFGVEIVAWVQSVGNVEASLINADVISREEVDQTIVRCPDKIAAHEMVRIIEQVREMDDSIGGVITCVCRNVPAGWGEPVFDKMEAKLAQAMLSIPSTKGFEIGSGFAGTRMFGSQHNDPFILKGNRLGTTTNFSGGVQGGITNGEPIVFRTAFKPPSTISLPQTTADFEGKATVLEAKGRHDPCVVPRAVPIVESMAALVIGDFALRQQYRQQ
ncbi:MAG: chorismate synthase [Desulfobacterales bacterium]